MLDSLGRNITYLRLSVTELCNLKCIYCMPQGLTSNNHKCTFDELYEMAKAAVDCGINKIRITGGEPLTRDGIIDFCHRLSELKGVEKLCLTTNGSLLSRYAEQLYLSGIRYINISLDTLKEDKYKYITGNGDIKNVLEGIKILKNYNFKKIKINCVLIKGFNDDEILDFIELTKNHNIDVRFIELMPIGACKNWSGEKFMSVYDVLKICKDLKPISNEGVSDRYSLDNAEGTVGLIAPLTNIFCKECNRIRITADGNIKPCLHSNTEISLRNLDFNELKNTITKAILNKPSQHYMNTLGVSETLRFMNQIGG